VFLESTVFKDLLRLFRLWRLHRQADALEARFVSIRANHFRRGVR
jgi:hypothetical protein